MRGIILLAMLAGTLAHAAFNDYIEVRDLVLDAAGIERLDINTGSGPLVVTGVPGADRITVSATITVPGESDDEALRILEDGLTFRLQRDGNGALLESSFDGGFWSWGDTPHIELAVNLPQRLALTVEDGAGSIQVRGVGGAIRIEDGSGSIEVRDVGDAVRIDDGSGSLVLSNAGGSVDVDDGSGSIEVEGAGGDVRIVDGSGKIDVRQVAGSVYIDDGSGGITVDGVAMDLVVEESGSGGIDYSNVLGRVDIDE